MKFYSMSSPPQDINLDGVLSETRFSKIKAYTTPFIIFSSLFFLIPMPYVFLVFPLIFSTSSDSNSTSTSTSTTAPTQDINIIRVVLTETTRIVKSYENHFTVLSLLFLLPFSMLVFMYQTISPIGIFRIIYIMAAIFFLIYGIGTITYTTVHGYYNQPLELINTIKSLSSSVIPLYSTMIFILLINGLLPIGIPGVLLYNFVLVDDYHLIFTLIILGVAMAFVYTTYVQLHLILAIVIAVVESKWGYEPLRRSTFLIKGLKKEALMITLVCGVCTHCFLIWEFYEKSKYATWGLWMFIYQIISSMCTMVIVLVWSLTAPVVLYIYSKKKHGELAMEFQPEEYGSLPSDDDNNKYVDVVDG